MKSTVMHVDVMSASLVVDYEIPCDKKVVPAKILSNTNHNTLIVTRVEVGSRLSLCTMLIVCLFMGNSVLRGENNDQPVRQQDTVHSGSQNGTLSSHTSSTESESRSNEVGALARFYDATMQILNESGILHGYDVASERVETFAREHGLLLTTSSVVLLVTTFWLYKSRNFYRTFYESQKDFGTICAAQKKVLEAVAKLTPVLDEAAKIGAK